MFNKHNAAQHGSKGGRRTVERHGREHMAQIGKRGFQATTERHFGGCVESHKRWLAQKGLFNYWVQTGLPMRYGVDGRPIYRDTFHPSRKIPF